MNPQKQRRLKASWAHDFRVRILPLINEEALRDAFCEDNDPYGEHDFGAFEVEGEKLFWKIDYYDKALEHGSEDPADPTRTTRVLTVMLASEY